MEHPPSSVTDHEPDLEELESDGRQGEEIHPGDQISMVPEKCLPPLLAAGVRLSFRETREIVERPTQNPSLPSSAWIFQARQRFSVAMRAMRALASSGIGGLPGPEVEIERQ